MRALELLHDRLIRPSHREVAHERPAKIVECAVADARPLHDSSEIPLKVVSDGFVVLGLKHPRAAPAKAKLREKLRRLSHECKLPHLS